MNHKIALRSILASLAMACGGETEAPNSNDAGAPSSGNQVVPRSEAGRRFREALCQALAPCCGENGFPFNETACGAKAETFQSDIEETIAKHPGWVYDGAKLRDCIAEMKTSAACISIGTTLGSRACAGWLRGATPPGGECKGAEDCALPEKGKAACASTGTSQARCIHLLPPAEGMACLGGETPTFVNSFGACDDQSDDPAFYCNAEQKCARTKRGTCSTADSACADGFYCDTQKNCIAHSKPGDACVSAIDGPCEFGCDELTSKCRTNAVSSSNCEASP